MCMPCPVCVLTRITPLVCNCIYTHTHRERDSYSVLYFVHVLLLALLFFAFGVPVICKSNFILICPFSFLLFFNQYTIHAASTRWTFEAGQSFFTVLHFFTATFFSLCCFVVVFGLVCWGGGVGGVAKTDSKTSPLPKIFSHEYLKTSNQWVNLSLCPPSPTPTPSPSPLPTVFLISLRYALQHRTETWWPTCWFSDREAKQKAQEEEEARKKKELKKAEKERKRQEAQARKVPKKKADHSTDEEPAEGALTGKPGWWGQVGFSAVRSLLRGCAVSLIGDTASQGGCKLASTL